MMAGDWNDEAAWHRAATGVPPRNRYWNIRRDPRGFPIFVKAGGDSGEGDQDIPEGEAAPYDLEAQDSDLDVGRSNETDAETPAARPTETIAELYARLARQSNASRADAKANEPASATAPSPRSTIQSRDARKTASKSSSEDRTWFVSHADRARRDAAAKPPRAFSSTGSLVVSPKVPVQCHGCKAILTPPVTVAALEAHQSSIGHQLAVDKNVAVPAAPVKTIPKAATAKDAVTVLQSFNVGYVALERMGWRSGMGLGRDEWDHAQRVTSMSQESHRSPTLQSEVTGPSREEEPSSMKDGGEASQLKLNQDSRETTPNSAERTRPMLEPIPLLKRPDRRGIGNALPASARVRDRPRPSASDGDASNFSAVNADKPSNARPSKKLKPHQRYRREQEELKALRQSLND